MIEKSVKKLLQEIGLSEAESARNGITGFVHYDELIPLFENFLAALLFLESKIAEKMKEGMHLLSKLLHFQAESGAFPRYIHDYPSPASPNHLVHILTALRKVQEMYGKVLDKQLRERTSQSAALLEKFLIAHEDELKPVSKSLLQSNDTSFAPSTTREWSEYLYAGRVRGLLPWNARCLVADIECDTPAEWRNGKIVPSFFDFYAASQLEILPETLREKSREHLQTALLSDERVESGVFLETSNLARRGNALFFASEGGVFSCVMEPSEGIDCAIEKDENGFTSCMLLPPNEGVHQTDEVVFSLYFAHEGTPITINGEKQLVFQKGDSVQIGDLITLTLTYPEGDFMGHISRSDRPHTQKKAGFTHSDWKITLRCLRRNKEQAAVTLTLQM